MQKLNTNKPKGSEHTNNSRRDFLKLSGALVGASTLSGFNQTESEAGQEENPVSHAPLVGTQMYGWGQYYSRMNKSLWGEIDEALSGIRDGGFAYAEPSLNWGRPEETAEFAERLRGKGMQPVSVYTGGKLHVDGEWEATVLGLVERAEILKQAGYRIIVCNPDATYDREKSDAELETQAGALSQLGAILTGMGMQLGLHHHTPAMRSAGREFHSNFRKCDPADVGFCIDTHWVFRGGTPPMEALNAYHDRVVSWHLRQSRNRVWWETLDCGDIDYDQIAAFARRHNMQAPYTVELALEGATKVTRSVVENHKISREFVQKVFGV